MEVILSIADSDSSGCSGIQADLKTFEMFNTFGTTAITAIVAKNTVGTLKVLPLDSNSVRAQIDAIMNDFKISAIKIGMLYTKENIIEVKKFLYEIKDKNITVVFDPLIISKNSSKLLKNNAIEELKELLKLVTIVTPNSSEFKEFFKDLNSAKNFASEFNTHILIKDLTNNNSESIDVLIYPNENVKEFKSQKINTTNTLGSGSSFSSAIASLLAKGREIDQAVFIAKKFIFHAIKSGFPIGEGDGPINHQIGRSNIDNYLV